MSTVFPIVADARYRLIVASSNQTAFTVPFPFLENGDLTAYKIDLAGVQTLLARPANYTLTGAADPDGGTLTLKVGARAGEKILIVGAATRARGNSVVRGGKFDSKAQDQDLDRLTLIAQEHDRDIGRALKVVYGSDGPTVTPGGAGTVPKWDADGNLVEGPDSSAIEAAESLVGIDAGRALVYPAAPADPIYNAHSRKIGSLADATDPQQAVTLAQLNLALADIDFTAIAAMQAQIDDLQTRVVQTAMVIFSLDDDVPDGWLRVDARTIGDASSGATARADADCEPLFLKLWAKYSNTLAPIQDSAGAASVRGANAAADWAAHKRLPLLAFGGEFIRVLDGGRGVDVGRLLGTAQTQSLKNHTHLFAGVAVPPHAHAYSKQSRHGLNGASPGGTFRPSDGDSTTGQTPTMTTDGGGGHTPAGTISPAGDGTENRPRNIALPLFVKL